MSNGPTSDWFHQAALAVGFVAHAEGWLADSDRVKRAVYTLYESGEWPERPPPGLPVHAVAVRPPLAFPGDLGQDAPTRLSTRRTEEV
ncbi:MAG: hypothetical protein C0501_31625 [Isosphaera sp.]|nr:hypothetical protein [Isosphaera sp.]